jgi:hypothetical protein
MFHIKSKYMDEVGTIHKTCYSDGSLAVVFRSNEGNTTLSVNLADYGATPPEDHFFVKNYSEGEGMVEAIEKAGIAEALADFRFGSFDTTATLMKLIAA